MPHYTFETIFERDIALHGLFHASASAIKRAFTGTGTPTPATRFANNHSPFGVREIEDKCREQEQVAVQGIPSGLDLKG